MAKFDEQKLSIKKSSKLHFSYHYYLKIDKFTLADGNN